MNWLLLLKIVGVGAGGGALAALGQAFAGVTNPILLMVAPVLSTIGAYLLQSPLKLKP